MFAEFFKKRSNQYKMLAAGLLLVLALVSIFWLAGAFSSPESHKASIAALDEKKVTVMELTAATALASVGISAVPGDATTPIASQIAELSSYLMLVAGIIMLEKFLLMATGKLAFGLLIPFACALGAVHQFWPRAVFRQLAIRIAAFSVAICFVIPVSVWVGAMFEETFQLQQTVQNATEGAEKLEGETEEEEPQQNEPSGQGGSFGEWLAGLGEQITGNVGNAVEKAKTELEALLSTFIDAVAVLLISNCAIPILVLFLFLWLLKAAVSVPLAGGRPRPMLPPADPAPRQ